MFDDCIIMAGGFNWLDVGSWDEYSRLLGNTGSVLIAKKGETQRVREIVEQIKNAGRTSLL
jgi:hypothetical protein